MILSYNTIKKLTDKNLLIENANVQNIHSSSYDVTADKYILKFKKIVINCFIINPPYFF